jgi:hypothetical protein
MPSKLIIVWLREFAPEVFIGLVAYGRRGEFLTADMFGCETGGENMPATSGIVCLM